MPELMPTPDIALTLSIKVPPGKVWTCLTRAEAIAAWWSAEVQLEPHPGGRFREMWTDADGRSAVTSGIVLHAVAPKILELTWADDDWPTQTRVTFTLGEDGSETLLTLHHAGWSAFTREKAAKLVRDHEDGWTVLLQRLKACAERASDS